ncbi:MAG TPA: hypothetical protein EYQ51_02565 [Alphaproteobacteria bacterium]|nr:hypothetical protein [Alphaproteobacteria bacterium]
MKNLFLKLVFILTLFFYNSAYSEDTIEAFVVNLSEMNSQIKVTDLICNKVIYDDLMDAKSNVAINLCKGEDGLGQVELFIKIGCTKNKTIVKKNVTDGKKIPFLPTK